MHTYTRPSSYALHSSLPPQPQCLSRFGCCRWPTQQNQRKQSCRVLPLLFAITFFYYFERNFSILPLFLYRTTLRVALLSGRVAGSFNMDYYSSQVRREEAAALRSRLAAFVEGHEQQLFEAQHHFAHPTDATDWCRQHDVVTVQLGDTAAHTSLVAHHQPRQRRQLQQTSIADLLGGAMMRLDPMLFRLTVTLAALNAEMQALADEGRRCLAPPLALIGDENENCYEHDAAAAAAVAGGKARQADGGSGTSPSSTPSSPLGMRHSAKDNAAFGSGGGGGGNGYNVTPEQEEALREERLLHQTGALLPLLQRTWLWQQRVQEVCTAAVCQLACVYNDAAGAKSRDPPLLRAVRLTSCWDSLGELLGVVVLVEELLQQSGSLREGVEVMQRALAQQTLEAHQDGPAGGDDDDDALLRLLLHRLEKDLLKRRLLHAVVGQPFDKLLRAAAVQPARPLAGSGATTAPPPPPFHENAVLCAEWAAVLTSRCNDLEAALTSPKGAADTHAFAAVCGLTLLFQALFVSPSAAGRGGPPAPMPAAAAAVSKTAQAKLLAISKQVVSWQSALPLIPLLGLHALCPLLWWQRSFPAEAAAGLGRASVGARIQESVVAACQGAGAQFGARVSQWTTQVERWAAVEMQTAAPLDAPLCRHFVQRLVLLIQQGVMLARTIQRGLIELLFLHHHAERPLATSMVSGVLQGILLLQRIADAYHAKMGVLAASHEALAQSIAYALEKHLYSLYARAIAGRSEDGDTESQDQLVALQGSLRLLQRPLTTDCLLCLSLLLDIALNRAQLHANAPPTTASEQERDEVFIALVQLRNVVSYQETLPALTQVSFLYFFREALYPLFFRHCYENTLSASSLPPLVTALSESRTLIMAAEHVAKPANTLLVDYAAFLRDCLHHEVVQPLSAEIENQLRLRTHDVVLGQPYRVLRPSGDAAGRDLTRFTLLPPFRLLHGWVHLSAQIEHYLSTQFYNLNALTPNDWRTYEEMRNLAHRTYHLRIADGHLPGCILDQGLDVLVITENIQQFIVYYTYNLNEQIFIQRPSLTASKHMHTLNTRHIANSIRTHGTGVMNTAVNYVYKCLLKKLAILSHFLQDDYIRSHLLKDARVVRQRKAEHQPIKYPIEQADQLIREMGRLGVAEDGASFLEKARQLIGEMGNALGFMRMMRSGGLRAVAEGARFVPLPSACVSDSAAAAAPSARLGAYAEMLSSAPLFRTHDDDDDDESSQPSSDDDETGKGESAQQSLRRSTAAAVGNLDRVTHSMLQQLSDGSEYFPLLLDAIGRRLRRSSAERYAHLHLLYLLVPALANLHVAYAIQEKEKLLKKHKDEGVFSDDGFAVGTTFLLVLFGVYEDFDSLHWFDNKKTQHRQTLESVHAALGSATASGSSDFDNLHLTSSTLQTNLREYTGLENAFTSSRLFFGTAVSTAGAKTEPRPASRSRRPAAAPDAGSEEDGDENVDDDEADN